MKLLVVISLIACSYAAQLDRAYLPPPGANAAGGSPGSLTGPGGPADQGFGLSSVAGLTQPAGTAGTYTQTSGTAGTFGQPSAQYGSPSGASGSSTGAFGFGSPQTGRSSVYDQTRQYQPERARATIDRNADTIRYDNKIDGDTFSYSFETSNGISADESGVATNGVQAQGGFAYTADDGQVYQITYTADENGYQPRGDHLPTSPPIPEEILRSIEQNARAAAAGTQEGAYNPNEGSSFGGDQGYQYNTPSAGISRSDTGSTGYTSNQGGVGYQDNYQGSVSQGGYQASDSQYNTPSDVSGSNPSSLGSVSGVGYPSQTPSQQYNRRVSGGTQPNRGSSRPRNQYIPPGSGFGPSQPNINIGSKQQYSPSTVGPTASRPDPTASGQSPSGLAPSGSTAGPTNPTNYASVRPSLSAFAVSNTAPSGFAPSGPTAAGSSFSTFAPSAPSPTSSGFATSSPTVSATRTNAQSVGVQISEYSRAGQVSPQRDDGYNYNRPQPAFGSRTQKGSAGSQKPTSSSNQGFIINVQGPTESAKTAQSQYQPNKPSGSPKSMSGSSGYDYDRPGTQSGPTGAGAGKGDDGRSDQFGGPRQPPSFSQDEGYKY